MFFIRLLRESKQDKQAFHSRLIERGFEATRGVYAKTLGWVLHHSPVMMVMFVVVLGFTAYLYVIVTKGFIPETDNDQFNINFQAAQGNSYYQMIAFCKRVSQIVIQDQAVTTFFARTGGGGGGFGGANTGSLSVNLKPRRQRKETVVDIVNRIHPKLGVITGFQLSISIPQSTPSSA